MADTVLGPVPRGDTIQIRLPITRPDTNNAQQPVDLTSATLKATFKSAVVDTDPGIAQKTSPSDGIVISGSPTLGVVIVTLDPADTHDLVTPKTVYWDVQLNEAGLITTVDWGTLLLIDDITRAAS